MAIHFLLLLSALSALSVSADVFTSIDCGSSDIYTDPNSIVWMGDNDIIQNGVAQTVPPSNSISHVMDTLRVFTTRKKNCYIIKADKGGQVLVRASFYYGNYDQKSAPPTFDLQFDGNDWATIVTSSTQMVYYEVTYVVKGDSISVCVAQTKPNQFPFMSALEVRSLGSNMYSHVDANFALFLSSRTAYGAPAAVRFSDDPYDRIWETGQVGNGLLTVASDALLITTSGAEDDPPMAAVQNAITTSATSEYIILGPKFPAVGILTYITLYFSEVTQLDPTTQKRSFRLYKNNQSFSQPIIPPYETVTELYATNFTASSNTTFTLVATSDSTLPPIINAMEVFYISDPLTDGTNSIDDVRQPPKNFRQNFYLGKDLNKLLGLPLEKRKAPLLLNFVPTYTSKLADVPRQRKRKASPPTASIDQVASTSEPADQPSTSAPKKRSRRLVKAAKMKQPSKKVLNLLADLPDDMDDEPAQTTPQPKPKKVKKAQSKAKATEVDDAEDAVPISRLTKKTTSAPAKRPAEVQPTGATQQKKQKSAAGTSSGSRGPKIPWEPKVTIEDRPVYRNESAADVEIGVALSTAVLLDGDMEKNEKMNGYANYARMLQHSVQAIQHAHTFSMMAFETGKRLEETEKELADLQKSQKEDHLRMKELEDQAAEATKAKQIADEKAEATEALRTVAVAQQKEAEEKAAQAQKELQEGLATKEADLKASYDKGMDDVAEDYKLQVKQACNHGFILGYNALAKKLNLPADSPWRKTESLRLPCPLPPSPSQADVESESEAEAEDEDKDKDEALVRKAKSSSKDGQVLDLTGDEDLDAAPKKVDIGNLSSDLLLIGRSMEETLAEIDAEVEADKQAEVSENKEAEVVVDKEADAEVIPPKSSDVPAQSSANAEVV